MFAHVNGHGVLTSLEQRSTAVLTWTLVGGGACFYLFMLRTLKKTHRQGMFHLWGQKHDLSIQCLIEVWLLPVGYVVFRVNTMFLKSTNGRWQEQLAHRLRGYVSSLILCAQLMFTRFVSMTKCTACPWDTVSLSAAHVLSHQHCCLWIIRRTAWPNVAFHFQLMKVTRRDSCYVAHSVRARQTAACIKIQNIRWQPLWNAGWR